MKTQMITGLLFVLACSPTTATAEESNSKYFEVSNYYFLDRKGDFRRYQARGFYEQGPNDTSKKKDLILLPSLSVDLGAIKYINTAGHTFVPDENDPIVPRAIRIPIQRSLAVPSETQLPALGAAVSGAAALGAYLPQPLVDANGQPSIFAPASANPAIVQIVFDTYHALAPDMIKQAEFANVITSYYNTRIIDTESVSVSIKIDDEIVSSGEYKGSLLTGPNLLATLSIKNPDEYIFNRIHDGSFDLYVSYRFLDKKTSFIKAKFDTSRVINSFLSKSQSLYTESKESGWSFLGISSRRSSLRQFFNEQIDQSYNDHSVENSVIEMLDADDDMIKEFEERVFPRKSLDEVIAAHTAAAADPNLSQELRDVHKKYADALVSKSLNLETDAAGAAASFAAGDYLGFFAKGVRFGSSEGIAQGEFRSVIQQSADVSTVTNWLSTKSISLRRSVTDSVTVAESADASPRLGICGLQPWILPWSAKGMLITCAEAGGPLAQAGLVPGMIVTKIDGHQAPQASQELSDLLANHQVGDRISLTFLNLQNQQETKHVTLSRGMPR